MSLKALKWLKRIAFILALCTLLCLTGCGGGEEEASSSSDSSQIEEPGVYHKVGFIFSGKADIAGFASEINGQRILASNRTSMDTCYIENVTISEFETAVKKLAEAGCTDIVSCSAIFTNVARVIAGKYMNLNFINYGATSGSANCIAYTEHTFQGAYVAGIAAGYNSTVRKIGVVVDSDLIYDTAVANAIALGVQRVFKTATVYVGEGHYNNEIKDAIDALRGYGCDVIVTYTASAYAADYCQSLGVKFISNHDHSSNYESYSNMIMYYYSKRDSYLVAKFKQMQLDQWQPENYVGTMGNGVITVSHELKGSKADLQKIIDAITPKLSTGEAYIFDGKRGELMDNTGIVKCFQNEELSLSEIYNMEWYVMGITKIGSFRKPFYNEPPNNFEIKE
ncbi:MAG: BMP family ABC transporter substrate-binding protein [Oscillospiraceae bacterium]|nr:BMP family ABC transporter substrate-binding protein [Oscillospiraceae bacterium]